MMELWIGPGHDTLRDSDAAGSFGDAEHCKEEQEGFVLNELALTQLFYNVGACSLNI